MPYSSVVGGCGGTVDPGGWGVDEYCVAFCLRLLPVPNMPAEFIWFSLSLNCRDSMGSGSLPMTPATI